VRPPIRSRLAAVGGDTGSESIAHELPRRLPAEPQPDAGPILNPYAVLYPGMTHRLDDSSYGAVSSSSATVLKTIGSPIEAAAHMRITRDLSAACPAMIQARVKNGCPEGRSGARRSTTEHPGAHLCHPGGPAKCSCRLAAPGPARAPRRSRHRADRPGGPRPPGHATPPRPDRRCPNRYRRAEGDAESRRRPRDGRAEVQERLPGFPQECVRLSPGGATLRRKPIGSLTVSSGGFGGLSCLAPWRLVFLAMGVSRSRLRSPSPGSIRRSTSRAPCAIRN
jgi:hypothetical protein